MEMFVDSSDWVMAQMYLEWHSLAMGEYLRPSPIFVEVTISLNEQLQKR